jgi:2'-5' RNA ligase
VRAFLAVWPSTEVADLLGGLDRPTAPGLRWTRPHQWHVTLRFCGEVPDGELPALVDALRAGLVGEPSAVVTTAGATAQFDRSGVLHLPVTGLDRLAGRVRAASAPFGDAHDDRPFSGHLTLARARARRALPPGLVGRAVEPVTWTAGEVAVVASTLDPAGARYRTVAAVPLTG